MKSVNKTYRVCLIYWKLIHRGNASPSYTHCSSYPVRLVRISTLSSSCASYRDPWGLETSLCFRSPLWQNKSNHAKAPLVQHKCDHKRSQSTGTAPLHRFWTIFLGKVPAWDLTLQKPRRELCCTFAWWSWPKRRWVGFWMVGFYRAGSTPSRWEGWCHLRGGARDFKSEPPADAIERAVALKPVTRLHPSLPVFVMHSAITFCHSY